MTPEQQLALDAITADVTAAQALVARARAAAHNEVGMDVTPQKAQMAMAAALNSLRLASEELRKAALNG